MADEIPWYDEPVPVEPEEKLMEKRVSKSPEWGTEDYRRWAVLFNDITHAPVERHLLFSTRYELTEWLWEQGWRRDKQPAALIAAPSRCHSCLGGEFIHVRESAGVRESMLAPFEGSHPACADCGATPPTSSEEENPPVAPASELNEHPSEKEL